MALVTGQTRGDAVANDEDDYEEIDWRALAKFPGTLVLYMGVRRLEEIAASLIDGGRPARAAGGGRRSRDAPRVSGP